MTPALMLGMDGIILDRISFGGVTLPPCNASHSRLNSAKEWRQHGKGDTGAVYA